MQYINTVKRLIELLGAHDVAEQFSVRNALTRLIEAQVDRVRDRIFTSTLESLDHFGGKQ